MAEQADPSASSRTTFLWMQSCATGPLHMPHTHGGGKRHARIDRDGLQGTDWEGLCYERHDTHTAGVLGHA